MQENNFLVSWAGTWYKEGMTGIRRLPAWQIAKRMKARRIRQSDVALRVGVSVSFVHDTIARRKPEGNAKAAEVWRVLEEVLGG